MKKILKGYVLGFLSASLLVTGIGYAANTTTLYDVLTQGVKIVVDGQKINPTDANGNAVEPIIYNGTTYLPVRAVANAIGKAVYWDGPNYTVYLGNMDGKLEYPTVMVKDMTCISSWIKTDNKMTDNYGNTYSPSLVPYAKYNGEYVYEYLINMKYSRFKGTLYIPNGTTSDKSENFSIIADGHKIYSSPTMTKISAPVFVDVDVTGYNDIKLCFSGKSLDLHLADAGFYQ